MIAHVRSLRPARRPRPALTTTVRALLIATVGALVIVPLGAAAQSPGLVDGRTGSPGGWTDDVVYAGANALVSGLVTGLFRAFSDDGSFGEGFRAGAAGGVVTYSGKRLAAQRFAGAGLLGRQVASVGGSVVSNAREGRGAFDRLTFQLGLGRLYWDRVGSRVAFRPDVVTLYYTALGVATSGVELDGSRTLSAGTPVFVTRRGSTALDGNAAGRAYGGVIVMDVNAIIGLADIAAHERVHVLQYDQQFSLWGEAAERGLFSLFGPGVADVLGRADLSIGLLPFVPFIDSVSHDDNPFEWEASHLTGVPGS